MVDLLEGTVDEQYPVVTVMTLELKEIMAAYS